MKMIKTAIAAAALAFALGTAANAQTAAPAPVKPAATTAAPAKTVKEKKPRSEASIKCSAEADAKNLHGKERKKFRDKCIKDAAKATTGAAKPADTTKKN